MSDYRAPLKDMRFVQDELAGFLELSQYPDFAEATPDMADAILDEAAKFAGQVLAPLNWIGDQEGCKLGPDGVITAPGWKEAAFAVVVILAVFVGFAVLRLLRPKSPPQPAREDPLLRGLQTELLGVRAQLDAMQADLDALRAELERLKAERAVSPQYNDALSLARKGMHAEDIAQACGISIGEAELVCALARTHREGGS